LEGQSASQKETSPTKRGRNLPEERPLRKSIKRGGGVNQYLQQRGRCRNKNNRKVGIVGMRKNVNNGKKETPQREKKKPVGVEKKRGGKDEKKETQD